MEIENILRILSMILMAIILLAIIAMTFWLIINKKMLSQMTDKLNRPQPPVTDRKFSVVVFNEDSAVTREKSDEPDETTGPSIRPMPLEKEDSAVTPSKSTTPDSTLRSTLSSEEFEKLKPRVLMKWKSDEPDETTGPSIRPMPLDAKQEPKDNEIRKIESENYVSFFSRTEIQEPNADQKPIEVVFEDIIPGIYQSISVENNEPIKDSEFSLEQI